MAVKLSAVLLIVAAVGLSLTPTAVNACVALMGEATDSLATFTAATNWTYAMKGDDWSGVDATNTSWVCLTGTHQSPVNLVKMSAAAAPKCLSTTWDYTPLKSNGSNIQVFNNGHTIQVQWTPGELQSNVSIWSNGSSVLDVLSATSCAGGVHYPITPLQFHFHTSSEHVVEGMYAPIELHIVHALPQTILASCPASGCLSVTGILMKIADNLTADNAAFDAIWKVMPQREGMVDYLPAGATLDIGAMLPPTLAYMQYGGSLTTPPCTEGVLWHVMAEPISISVAQYKAFELAVGLKTCTSKSTSRRSALGGHHHGHNHNSGVHADVLAKLAEFKRGAYHGFVSAEALTTAGVPRSAHRRLLDGDGGSGGGSNNTVCTVTALGWNNRIVQPVGDRTVLSFAA